MRTLLVIWFVTLLVAGCSSGPKTAPQAFDVAGVKVEFSPPPPEWKPRKSDPKDKDPKLLVFEHPSGNGYMAVGAVPGVKELDKDTLNQLGIDIVQSKGRIVSDKYVGVAGEKENAYRMEFEVNSGINRGLQVHFPHDGRLYSIVMTVPAAEFASSQKLFDQLVSSFKFPAK